MISYYTVTTKRHVAVKGKNYAMKKNDNKKTVEATPSFGKQLLLKIIYPGSALYTALTMIFYLCGPLFDLADRHMVLTRTSGFLLFAFAFIFTAANLILTMKKPALHISLRIFLHYAICLISFYVLFIDLTDYDAGRSSTIILLVAFTVVYFAICGTILAVRGIKKKSAIEASEYRSIYN